MGLAALKELPKQLLLKYNPGNGYKRDRKIIEPYLQERT